MTKYLEDDEVNELLQRIKAGDNDAWQELYKNFDAYIHDRAWKKLDKFDMNDDYRRQIEEELHMAGWQGFVSALKNYKQGKAKFITYATYYIDGEMYKELSFVFNPLGLTERPKYVKEKKKANGIRRVSLEDYPQLKTLAHKPKKGINTSDVPDCGGYKADRRALQILQVLRIITDEEHPITKDDLGKMLRAYRIARYNNGTPIEAPNTITTTLERLLEELNPMEFSDENDLDYMIKYNGYKEDLIKLKKNKKAGQRSKEITGFYYARKFTYSELDMLIQLICFSDMLSTEEKAQYIDKLIKTTSVYYKSPFWNGKLRLNPGAIHGRHNTRKNGVNPKLSKNLQTIQQAINNFSQICFKFNRYTSEHDMVPKTEYAHTLSPYHLVVYHDNFYCIGMKTDDKRVWHYRVDLMSEVQIKRNKEGRIIPIEVSAFEGLPISNAEWNPEKYMSEHLNMAYDEPKDIHIKIKNTEYTLIHDWFGNHYEKTKNSCENGYDIVKVRTSPSMIVHWAMQYGDKVEIMDEEIRKEIKEKLKAMEKKYGL